MHHKTCDHCSQPAVIHDTLVGDDGLRLRHLCRAHGSAFWRESVPTVPVKKTSLDKDPVFHSAVHDAGKLMKQRGAAPPPQ